MPLRGRASAAMRRSAAKASRLVVQPSDRSASTVTSNTPRPGVGHPLTPHVRDIALETIGHQRGPVPRTSRARSASRGYHAHRARAARRAPPPWAPRAPRGPRPGGRGGHRGGGAHREHHVAIEQGAIGNDAARQRIPAAVCQALEAGTIGAWRWSRPRPTSIARPKWSAPRPKCVNCGPRTYRPRRAPPRGSRPEPSRMLPTALSTTAHPPRCHRASRPSFPPHPSWRRAP